jgi:DNA-binding NarL/FixJ family response regulator
MIVDDSADSREMLRDALASSDVELFECDNGVSAIRDYESLHPDLVLMDIQMPECDGLTATQRIIVSHPDAHVVIVSQYDANEYRREALRVGAASYFLKQQILDLITYIEAQPSFI